MKVAPVHRERGHLLVSSAAWVSYLEIETFARPPREPRWVGGIVFDDAIRSAVVARTPRGRALAGLVSDILWITTDATAWAEAVIFPVVVGAALGLVVGYGAPVLLHYNAPRGSGEPAPVVATSTPFRLTFCGAF